MLRVLIFSALAAASQTFAGPVAQPGDIGLRHDIQVLADYGAITGPVTAWPISWDAVAADLEASVERDLILPVAVQYTFDRLRARARAEVARQGIRMNARLSASENPTRIQGFATAPRDQGEVLAGFSWLGERLSLDINATGASEPLDDKQIRADNSRIAVDFGRITVAASTMDRWWGPGWDGSLILSQNARPIPALTLSRNRTSAFETKWLSWLGPWDLDVIWGQLERERFVPNARFFGMRFTFRPVPALEVGLSRSAQWCGNGRPCDASTFWDLFLGKDNRGDDGTTIENEPGNQLAGLDFRWRRIWLGRPSAFYASAIAEDEAGGFPSRYMGQIGFETSGFFRGRWSYRWYVELAGTSCDFIKSDIFNCAYNHNIYETGYRFRNRVIGHGMENDARIVSSGLMLVNHDETQWYALLRKGDLNRGGAPDTRNTLTPTPIELTSVDLRYARYVGKWRVEIGVGYERLEDPLTGVTDGDSRAFLTWRTP